MYPETTVSPPRFFGVHVVRAAFVLAVFGWGVGFYGPAIYLAEVITRTGWSVGLVSAAVTTHFLFGALVIVNLPRLHARFGLPLVTTVGAIIAALGVMGWAVVTEPWELFVAAIVGGAGWVTMGAVAVNAIVSTWYVADRPVALAKAYNGASIGGVVFSPLWVALIGCLGFPAAAMVVGITMIGVVTFLSRAVFAKSPEQIGQLPDGGAARASGAKSTANQRARLSRRRLWQDRSFITLAGGMAIGLFSQIGLLEHLFKLLTPALGAQSAGVLMGGGTACAIAGRAIAAKAVVRFGDRRIVAAASYGIQALGASMLLFAQADQVWLIVLGVALFGSGIGNATSLPPLIAQTDFAAQDVSRVVALIVAIGQGTYAFAPAFFGWLQGVAAPGGQVSVGHHAGLFFTTAIGIQLGAAAVFLIGRRSH